MKIYLSSLLFLLLVGGASTAQEKVIISNDPPPVAARYPLVREVGKAQVFYNEKDNKTIVRSKGLKVYAEGANELSIVAEFVSLGKKVDEPKAVTLKIFYFGKDRAFLDDRTFKVFVKDAEVVSGTSRFIRANESNFILGALEKEVSLSEFRTISFSNDVRMQIGPATFVLGNPKSHGLDNILWTIEN